MEQVASPAILFGATMTAVLVLAVVLPMLLAAAFLLGRGFRRRWARPSQLSAVTRQHLELFQGGQLNEALVEAAKVRYRDLLERGEVNAVEASLRPGMHFVVQVRALAELGTDTAGKILERQLQRRLTDNPLEQSWYWIDLASGLRVLNRPESLPHLLRCAASASEVPLGHVLAAETVCFLGFAGYLRQLDSPLGRAALRVLHRALEGMRQGVQPVLIVEARLGEALECLWDHRPEAIDPLLCRVALETLRMLRRASASSAALDELGPERESYDWQMARLQALEPALSDYLSEAPAELARTLQTVSGSEIRDTLIALHDLRAEAGPALLDYLQQPAQRLPAAGCRRKRELNPANRELRSEVDLAVEALTWSRAPEVGAWLRLQARQWQGQQYQRWLWWRRRGTPSGPPRLSILRALRGHPSAESEWLLVQAAAAPVAEQRIAAVSSLGWWEPLQRALVLTALQQARRELSPDVRRAARAALARLGEVQALHWFRQALHSRELHLVHDTIQTVADEGLTLLWPDVDQLVDAEDSELAHHARETTYRLFEDLERRWGGEG